MTNCIQILIFFFKYMYIKYISILKKDIICHAKQIMYLKTEEPTKKISL